MRPQFQCWSWSINYKLTLSYDGTEFFGFQAQPCSALRTIEGALNRAIQDAFGFTPDLCVSGRTDRGVHARGQVVNFKWAYEVGAPVMLSSLNALLPMDIRILAVDLVEDSFHSRYSAKSKKYHYYFSLGPLPVFLDRFVSVFKYKFSRFDLIQDIESILVGEHNFQNFKALGSFTSSDVKTLYDVKIESVDFPGFWGGVKSGLVYRVCVCGSGFLYKMMRNIVGNIVEVLRGKRTLLELQAQLTSRNKVYPYTTVSPKGLSLISVEY